MKRIFTLLVLCLFSLLQAAGIHYSKVSGPVKNVGKIEIVLEKTIPSLKFTAQEMKRLLKLATGQDVPILKKPTGKAFAVILGDSSYTRAAGIDVKKLPEEGYVMLRKGNRLFIAGFDHQTNHPRNNQWNMAFSRNTLNGVYDFFERFADGGFFFPGPHGTVVPYRKGLFLPANLEVKEAPDMKMRTFYLGRNTWHEKNGYQGGVRGHNMNCLYHRLSHTYYPFGHGLGSLNFINRFGKTHPEYFALMKDGKRFCDPQMAFTGQICWNSKIKDEITKDVLAYFSGKPASSRGMKNWNTNGRYGKYFSVMAQDWFFWCGCEKCKKIAEPGRSKIYHDIKHNQAVSDHVWQFTCDIARALKKSGLPGIITQMAYRPYDLIPKCEFPDNVKVMVAVNSTGGDTAKDKKDNKTIRDWSTKMKQPVMLWTYAIGKFGKKGIPAVPPSMPRYMGKLIDRNKQYVDGIFWEAETENSFLQFYNLYTISRKMWNTSIPMSDIIDRHHKVMFGKGAPMMKKFYDELEEIWFRKILSNIVDTGLGPVTQVPSDLEIWTKIYSPAKIRQFGQLFDAAQKAVAADKKTLARVKYVRKYLLDPLKKQSEKFHNFQNAVDNWKIHKGGNVYLRAYMGEFNEVSTKVTFNEDKNNLIFRFDCEEPRMKDIKAVQTKRDSQLTYADSSVEILLNPSGDRKNYFQFIANSRGVVTDYKLVKNKNRGSLGIKWNSAVTAKAEKRANGWSVTVFIPKKDLGRIAKNMPANFARHRALNGAKPKEIYYQWSPLANGRAGFHEIERWGYVSFDKKDSSALLYEGFSGDKLPHYWGRKPGQVIKFDKNVFITNGKSLYMKNPKGAVMGAAWRKVPMKPNHRYRLSYFIKTKNIIGSRGAGGYISWGNGKGQAFPSNSLIGTNPWHRLSFEIKAPKDAGKKTVPSVSAWFWRGEGEAWFDEIKVEEIK